MKIKKKKPPTTTQKPNQKEKEKRMKTFVYLPQVYDEKPSFQRGFFVFCEKSCEDFLSLSFARKIYILQY